MVNYPNVLDGTFKALADGARRRILERLSRGEATLSALAEPLEISLPAVHQHVARLEEVGLVACEKRGRERVCRLDPHGFDRVEAWIAARRNLWATRLAALDRLVSKPKGGSR
jgi:DNA-binding transcriptional ArsR family regulator